jgi:hypothetical protein
MPDWVADIVHNPTTGPQTDNANLADEILRRANAWLTAEKINYAQYDLLRKRLKASPAVLDAKLDGNIIVLALADGSQERILPDDANLPEFTVIDSPDTWTILGLTWKKKYWIATFSATAVLIAVLSILAAKHR